MADTLGPDLDKKKSHRERHSGRKAERKKSKKDAQNPVTELTDKQRNPKAFAFNSAVRAERKFRRKQDIDTKKQHIPLVDRTPIEPPPILIAVVGPPKVGKTTLINNLIRLFSRSPMTDVKGPVTIVTGKKRRVTLIECNNDINAMIDIAKVADLVLLLCDASFGFEMEIFEFLNIVQVHGMPRIMGILTHLDCIRNKKTLKTVKRTLKHRFWTEVYAGAKLFYLSGMVHGEYMRNEIKNLGRFISVLKVRPLTWRSGHSYLLADRYEDLTPAELIRKNSKCDRTVSMYGYVRGVPLQNESYVHIAGLGDLQIKDISYLPDPCPLPEAMKKRALIEKEKLIYAPFSGVGGIVYDKDAVYVELGGSHSHGKRDATDEITNIVTNLIDTKETLDTKLRMSEMQIFSGSKTITAKDMDIDSEEDEEEDTQADDKPLFEIKKEKSDNDLDAELSKLRTKSDKYKEESVQFDDRIRRRVVFDKTDEEIEKEMSNEDDSNSEESDYESDEDADDNQKANAVYKKKSTTDGNVYTTLKDNKFEGIHSLISNVIKNIDNKVVKKVKFAPKISDNEDVLNSDDSDHSSNLDEDESENDDDGFAEENDVEENDSFAINKNKTNEDSSDDDDDDVDGDVDADDIDLKWKDNLAKKAQLTFYERQNSNRNLMKIVYGSFKSKEFKEGTENGDVKPDDSSDEDVLGGLFKKVSVEEQKRKTNKDSLDLVDSTLMMPWNANVRDWLDNQNKSMIRDCFVTGKWKEDEDAEELLRLDDTQDISDDDSDIFGDFEDMETGDKFHGKPGDDNKSSTSEKTSEKDTSKRSRNDDGAEGDRKALAEKKRKLKERFDSEYDGGDKSNFYDDLKSAAEKQSQLNKSIFDGMSDDMRVQIEGYRSGMYVRIEFERVPVEFIEYFDPTYPLVIGALNAGEQNVGYVNIRIKKHRWYKRILKTNDPLIVSIGWRRFQTVPMFAKLEDDLKFRYLKYTPEHLGCNAHFWGPITPQGTGVLALQSVSANPDIVKQQGFRIAATGVVQELTKSTQIMKKLKLIGHPMKIYKKTAFIKGMFNSVLEVGKFEGAKIKTVSGIRGQIKKAASKPEGCFRATFEDKIQLSDIVFCRTWYKVDVQQFYTPITTLLLPPDKKNQWSGLRTTGEIKRDLGIRNEVNNDHLYTPIVREAKVFKPFVIPAKLQRALPYRDKPKNGILRADRKQSVQRVAVIREPHEQRVANMMKMIKAGYDRKQTQQAEQMQERLAKHRHQIELQEMAKGRKLKQEKKIVFRNRSKTEIAREKRAEKGKGGGGKRKGEKSL